MKMTPAQAVSRGVLTVNGTVMLTMLGLPALTGGGALLLGLDQATAGSTAALTFLLSWPLAWLSWSLLVPRWRVWAYERVENLDALKVRGVEAGLIWREGHFFERTEIRTSQQRQRLRELEQAWSARTINHVSSSRNGA
ncbi:hypothetical protein [Brevundimonas sp.]|uniref:hypothetical protein n=1 Tax=Brevundimonas sp. TaxID=1871086 RepID=UPI003A90561B